MLLCALLVEVSMRVCQDLDCLVLVQRPTRRKSRQYWVSAVIVCFSGGGVLCAVAHCTAVAD